MGVKHHRVIPVSFILLTFIGSIGCKSRGDGVLLNDAANEESILGFHEEFYREGSSPSIKADVALMLIRHAPAILASENQARSFLKKKFAAKDLSTSNLEEFAEGIYRDIHALKKAIAGRSVTQKNAEKAVAIQFELDLLIDILVSPKLDLSKRLNRIRIKELQLIAFLESITPKDAGNLLSAFAEVRAKFDLRTKLTGNELKRIEELVAEYKSLSRANTAYDSLNEVYGFTIAAQVTKRLMQPGFEVWQESTGEYFGFRPADGKPGHYSPAKGPGIFTAFDGELLTPSITGGFHPAIDLLHKFGTFVETVDEATAKAALEKYKTQVEEKVFAPLVYLCSDKTILQVVETFLAEGGVFKYEEPGRYIPRPLTIKVGRENRSFTIEVGNKQISKVGNSKSANDVEHILEILYHEILHYVFDKTDGFLYEIHFSGGLDHYAIFLLEMRWEIIRFFSAGSFDLPQLNSNLASLITEMLSKKTMSDEFKAVLEEVTFIEDFVHQSMMLAMNYNRSIKWRKSNDPVLPEGVIQDLAYLGSINGELLRRALRFARDSTDGSRSMKEIISGKDFINRFIKLKNEYLTGK